MKPNYQIDSIKEKFFKFAEYITNEKNWKKGKPYYKGYIYVTVINAFWSFIESHLQDAYKRGHQDGYHDLETYIDQYCQTN